MNRKAKQKFFAKQKSKESNNKETKEKPIDQIVHPRIKIDENQTLANRTVDVSDNIEITYTPANQVKNDKPRFNINNYDIDFTKAVHQLLVPCIENLPNEWTIRDFDLNSVWLYNERRSLGVIISYQLVGENTWLHLSVSHTKRIPSHNELKEVKFIFFGDKKAIEVFPGKEEYIEDHPNCLHLYTCLDFDPLPDFRVRIDGKLTI